VFVLPPALTRNAGTKWISPWVSSRLLDICDEVDACEGLSIEAVVAAAAEMTLSGPAGKH